MVIAIADIRRDGEVHFFKIFSFPFQDISRQFLSNFCDPAMGPVKRPAPDALEETELFRKVLAAFWGIEVVTDAHFTWWPWRTFSPVLFLAAKDFPVF